MTRKGLKRFKRVEVVGRRAIASCLRRLFAVEKVHDSIPEEESHSLERILMMRQDRIGDMVISLPLFRRVRELYPESEIGVVASTRNAQVLAHETGFRVFTYGKNPARFLASMMGARAFRPDAVVDLHMHESTTSFLYAALSGAKWRLHVSARSGSGRKRRRDSPFPYSVRVPLPEGWHIVEATARLLSGLGRRVDPRDVRWGLTLSAEEEEFARSFGDTLQSPVRKCVALNISAGSPKRFWGAANCIHLCGSLLSNDLTPVLFHGPGDREIAFRIAGETQGVIAAPPTPTILHAAALLRLFPVLVTPDTSVVHIASSYGIPVVGLYPGDQGNLRRWLPWGTEYRVLQSEGPDSLESIEPGDVLSAVRDLLGQPG